MNKYSLEDIMKPDKVIEELHLKTYEYVQNQNSFVHLEKSSEKNFTFYDFTSEMIKLVRFLKTNNIDFEDDFKGNIRLIN